MVYCATYNTAGTRNFSERREGVTGGSEAYAMEAVKSAHQHSTFPRSPPATRARANHNRYPPAQKTLSHSSLESQTKEKKNADRRYGVLIKIIRQLISRLSKFKEITCRVMSVVESPRKTRRNDAVRTGRGCSSLAVR